MTNQQIIDTVATRCQEGGGTKNEFITLAITALVTVNGVTPREALGLVLGEEYAKLIPASSTGDEIMQAVLSMVD